MLSRLDILTPDVDKENKLLRVINKKIDDLNKGRSDDRRLQHALNVPAEVCCSKNGILFEFQHGSISNDPIEVLIDYDKLEPFLTADFQQMQSHNEDYEIFEDKIKPEPNNPAPARPTVPVQPVVKKKKQPSKQSYYHHQKDVKPKYKKRRRYSGAKRRSGHHGYSGKRNWTRRRQ